MLRAKKMCLGGAWSSTTLDVDRPGGRTAFMSDLEDKPGSQVLGPPSSAHQRDMAVRGRNLEAEILADLERGREELKERLRGEWGDDLPPEVKRNIARLLKEDLPRRAKAIARHYREEIRRDLELELQQSGEKALVAQIARFLVPYYRDQSPEEREARLREVRGGIQPSLQTQLARARACYKRHPVPELAASIERWTGQAARIPAVSRHLARWPLIRCRDADLYMLVSGSPVQREEAAKALIARGFVSEEPWTEQGTARHREAKLEIKQQAREKGWPWVRDWLRNVILPGALIEAAEDVKKSERLRIRLGQEWVLDLNGNAAVVEPWGLTDAEMRQWLRQRVAQAVDEAIAGPRVVTLESVVAMDELLDTGEPKSEEGLRVVDVLPDHVASPEETLLEEDRSRSEAADLLKVIDGFRLLPVEGQQLLALRSEGRPYEEIAELFKVTAPAARKRYERLLSALRKRLSE